MKKRLYQFIFFKLMGWKICGTISPELKKCILMVMPHTSNHDFYIGVLTRGSMGLEMNFVAKKELFQFPLNYYFEWMGGAALDRTGGLNLVDAIVKIFNKKEVFRLAIAPEGTRTKVNELRSGFYYIAVKASVPIVPVVFDWSKKTVKIGNPFSPTGNYENDLPLILENFKNSSGKIPDNGFDLN